MEEPISIPVDQELPKGQDYFFLRSEGIRYSQLLSGKIWTDFNHHDPGVTLLEQLCYAITDLGFRTDFELENLLFAKGEKGEEIRHTFFDPSEILPSHPLNINDYRKLLIDRVLGIKNAWVEPVRDNLQGIRGLFRVLLQVDEDLDKDEAREIVDRVRGIMLGHRNLCEDLDSVDILHSERISFSADIDIDPEVVGESLLAKVLAALDNFISPSVKSYNLEEMRRAGLSIEEIFDGPAPLHGLIRSTELLPLPSEIYVSKLIEIISSIPGIGRIRNFAVFKDGIRVEGDVITIEKDCFPILDTGLENLDSVLVGDYPIRFYRGQVRYNFDLNTANQILYSLSATYRSGFQTKKMSEATPKTSIFKRADLQEYYSLQHLMPEVYGVGSTGLPTSVGPQRRAQALQLKAYLMCFEQLLANHLSQLANVSKLFSLNEDVDQTYFWQLPNDIPEVRELVQGRSMQKFSRSLEGVMKRYDPFIERRNRFLDHLLARFGEQFVTDSLIKFGNSGSGYLQNDPEKQEKDLILAKIEFLDRYVELSRKRGAGFNYSMPAIQSENVSILEKRTKLFLNIRDLELRSLVDPIDGADLEDIPEADLPFDTIDHSIELEDDEDPLEFRSFTRSDEAESEEALDYSDGFIFGHDGGSFFKELLNYGIQETHYRFIEEDSGRCNILFKSPRTLEQQKVYQAASKDDAEEALRELIAYLKQVNQKCEGFHVLEHILLRRTSLEKSGFRIFDDNNDILMQNFEFAEEQVQRIITDDLLIFGIIKDNYLIDKENEEYIIRIKDGEGKTVIEILERYEQKSDAEKKIDDVIDFLNSLRKGNTSIYSKVEFFNEQKKDLLIRDDFYSLRFSVCFPAWPSRFQNGDFRDLASKIIRDNAPAHLVSDIYWLEIEEMEDFEDIYFQWLDEKSQEEPKQPDLDDLSFSLIEFIQNLMAKSKQ